jgi:hypothetical protein
LRKLFIQKKVFLYGEKENFEEYSLFLESAELSFAILINYLAEKNRPCPRTTVVVFGQILAHFGSFGHIWANFVALIVAKSMPKFGLKSLKPHNF